MSDQKDPEPTLSPTPTPVIDMEEGSYDINEMPLFAIGGTEYVPLSLELEQINSEKAQPDDTEEVEGEASDEEEDADADDGKKEETKEGDGTEDGAETGEAAEKYYNTYKIVLKSGLKFDDGSTVTADDVLFNIKKHAEPEYTGHFGLGELDIPEPGLHLIPADKQGELHIVQVVPIEKLSQFAQGLDAFDMLFELRIIVR